MRSVGYAGSQRLASRQLPGVGRQREALVAAPGIAQAEEREGVEEGLDRRLRHRLQHHAEEARCAREVTLPQGMAGVVLQRGMEHPADFGPGLQPAGEPEPRLLVPLQADGEGAEPPERQIAVVGSGGGAQLLEDVAQCLGMGLGGGYRAEHGVGMAHDVFRPGLDREVRAQCQRLAEERRGPSVVDDEHRAAVMGGRRRAPAGPGPRR